jgi:hypothetical protein
MANVRQEKVYHGQDCYQTSRSDRKDQGRHEHVKLKQNKKYADNEYLAEYHDSEGTVFDSRIYEIVDEPQFCESARKEPKV